MTNQPNIALQLTSTRQTYQINLNDLKEMFAHHLGVTSDKIEILATEKLITRSEPVAFSIPKYEFNGLEIIVSQ